jgi:Fic family protein
LRSTKPPPPNGFHHDRSVNDDVLPPLVQVALVHAQFETIHPFDDGNGRIGRALIHVVLRRRGVAPAYVPPISVVLANARDRYIDGLTRFREDRSASGSSILRAPPPAPPLWRRRISGQSRS